MIRTVAFFLVFWLYQIVIIPLQLLVILLHARGKTRASRRLSSVVARHWAQSLLFMSGCRCRVHGRINLPEDQPALYVSNHQGAFDIPILLARLGRPIGFVAKRELSRIPIVSTWMNHIGCVYLDRDDRRSALEVVKQAITHLEEGTSMVIFPEGTRSNGPQMGTFRKGSLGMAVRAGVPVVPLTLSGTYRIRKSGSRRIRPAAVDLVIHDPVFPAGLSPEEKNELSEKVRNIIAGGLEPGND